MTSRKSMWATMDRLEGKKEGSSYKHLEKEMKRQGYSKSKALEKAKKGSAFERQQKLISKERSEYAKKHPGTYKGRPIHELRKEAMLD